MWSTDLYGSREGSPRHPSVDGLKHHGPRACRNGGDGDTDATPTYRDQRQERGKEAKREIRGKRQRGKERGKEAREKREEASDNKGDSS